MCRRCGEEGRDLLGSHPLTSGATARSLIVCADDFGLDPAINQAVEEAHQHGILSAASLMVGAPAAAEAVARARRLPDLGVGLHLVLADGWPVLPPSQIPGLVRRDGKFDQSMGRAAIGFFLLRRTRRELAMEIRAQFEAFRATGLPLDHVNAHKHIHLHPTVADLILEIGRDFGMKAVRVPSEPVRLLRRAFPGERFPAPLYWPWISSLRRKLRRARLIANDHVFGVSWSGAMIEERLVRLLAQLPDGISEIYCHPATASTPRLTAAMPGYRHRDEYAALLSAGLKAQIAQQGLRVTRYADLARVAHTTDTV